MNKDIQYQGYATEPSDYECPDGQLAVSLNLISEDNQLKPIFQPHNRLQLPDKCNVIYIHKTTNGIEHYIIKDANNVLYWTEASAETLSLDNDSKIDEYSGITHVNAVGNTLIVFTETAVNYLLWKNKKYNVLGNKLPEIAISFGLIGHPRLYSIVKEDDTSSKRGTFSISFNSIEKADIYNTFSDENKTKITAQVMAKVNKFIAEQTVNKGRFCFPFFVRWAYRLYDGAHIMHSPPVLMTPSTTPAPIVLWKKAYGKSAYNTADLDIMMVAADLDYCLTKHGNYYELEDWKDIISAIDIFISKPIYTYDQNGEVTSFNDDDNFQCKFIGRLYNGEKDMGKPDMVNATTVTEDRMLAPLALTSTCLMTDYMEFSYDHIYALYFDADRKVPCATLHMPEFSDNKRDEYIEDNANFYKLATLDISDLEAGTRKTIDVKDDYLQSLTSREVMTDDYLTHDRLIAEHSYAFNNRLNLAGVKRVVFGGFVSNAMFPHCTHVYSFAVDTSTKAVSANTVQLASGNMKMRIYIRENGEVFYVENNASYYAPAMRYFVDTHDWTMSQYLSDGTSKVTEYKYDTGTKTVTRYDSSGNITSTETSVNSFLPVAWGSWLFYPNSNAFKIAVYDNLRLAFVADLKPHDFLNGAYAFLGFKSQRSNTPGTLPGVTASYDMSEGSVGMAVDVPNKIYTSEVNNPFYFPLLGINTVGSGKILGISSANKALSQGQFGQFPLYAFTSDGVWALEVSANGTYSAKQPITRDVCNNAKGITQLDSAVLFPTDKGIMIISGAETKCITDDICAQTPFNVSDLPDIDKLHAMLGDTHENDTCIPVQSFRGFLSGCRMVYDYLHQRIVVYNPTMSTKDQDNKPVYNYAYVYSLKSKRWGMTFSNLAATVNAYPEAMAMTHDNTLVSFNETDETTSKGLLVTRPIKLDEHDRHKTINAIVQRGHFQRGDVATVLYASRDLYNWRLVWSSKDHYLRGFRGTPYKYFRLLAITSLSEGMSVFGASVSFENRLDNQLR